MAKKTSEYGGKGVEKSTVHDKPRGRLTAEERRRLMLTTGTDNPKATPNPAWFKGQRPSN